MYDSNPQTSSNASISQGSYASDQGLNNPARRNSSSTSLGISEELAFIKREVASLKDQVWNRAHNDFLPSEDCSIQNSFTDAQPDQSYNDERGLRNKGSPYNSNYFSRRLSANQVPNNAQQMRSGESSAYASELERNNPCEVTLGNTSSPDYGSLPVDKEMLYNGVIAEGSVTLDGKMYIVASVNNGIKNQENQSKKTTTCQNNPLVIRKTEVDPTSNGLTVISLKPISLSSENKLSLISQNNSKPKFKELVSAERARDDSLKRVIFTDIASQRVSTESEESFNLKEQELANRNSKMLEEENVSEEAEQHRGYNPLLKKTLSVIFSTNESIESTPPQSLVRRTATEMTEEPGVIKLLHTETKDSRYTTESVKRDNREDRTIEDSFASSRSEEKRSGKEIQITETNGTVLITEGVSSLGSEETFMGLLCVTKLQNKSNRGLEEKLNRLADLYNKQIEKFEKTVQMLNEKNEKYTKGNELLVKTLRTCEKEIDSLALNNQTLHKNLVMFEEDMSKKKIKEKQLMESNAAKQKEIEKLRDDLKKKDTEIEDMKKRSGMSTAKVESAKTYAKSCEESIAAIDQTLRRILTDKGGPKMSLIIVNKVLESIFAETSKFVGRVERSATVPTATLETESKSPSRNDNIRCFTSIGTEDTVSTFDYRDRANQSNSAQKKRSKTPDTHSLAMSPKGKALRSMKTMPQSPTHNENKVLMQRSPMSNQNNTHQRSVSSNIRRSFDHRRTSDREENSVLRPSLQNTNATVSRRESINTSPCSKTPDNKKSKTPVKIAPELDKIKENLRRKVLSHVSPNPSKR